MARFGKWIGGGLGWALGGPIGAIVGFTLGSYFDDVSTNRGDARYGSSYGTGARQATRGGDFAMALMVLAGAVMKADGKVLKSELDYVKRFLVQQLGDRNAQDATLALREILKQDYDYVPVCGQIRQYMDLASRVQLLHFLFGIAKADGEVHAREVEIINQMSVQMGINNSDYESIKAMFVKETTSAYKILEVDKSATDEEVKKAYRRMAVEFHPDKVAHLGPEFQQDAKEKFQAVNDAYERIKTERGIS
jgi:DnaJ like chaperone protein